MLGWEFPPIINGGLGVACHDLSRAMSALANITMMVPKSSPDFKMKNMNIVGINNVDINSFDPILSKQCQGISQVLFVVSDDRQITLFFL